MKINYKNTCLHFLDHPDKIDFYLPDTNKNMTEAELRNFAYSIKSSFKDMAAKENEEKSGFFRQKVRLLTAPFLEAFEKGKSRLIDVFDKEEIEETGVYLTQLGSYTNTYFYYIKTYFLEGEWTVDWCLLIFTKSAQAELPGLDCCIFDTKDSRKSFIYKEWEDQGLGVDWWMSWLVTLPVFLKHCPLDTKIVNGNRKEHHVGQKYVNETGYAVEILDSTWFTTIIRSQGFKVGGHFRKQYYGPGMSQWRIQWIAPFDKHGYTKKARIL